MPWARPLSYAMSSLYKEIIPPLKKWAIHYRDIFFVPFADYCRLIADVDSFLFFIGAKFLKDNYFFCQQIITLGLSSNNRTWLKNFLFFESSHNSRSTPQMCNSRDRCLITVISRDNSVICYTSRAHSAAPASHMIQLSRSMCTFVFTTIQGKNYFLRLD